MRGVTLAKSALLVLVLVAVSSCSINRMVVRRMSDVLAGDGGGNVFTTDDDPELIEAALPFVLKLYDALIEQDPQNAQLLLGASSGYISYANAFLQTPAEMLPRSEFEQRERMMERAKRLYLRGRDLGLRGLAVTHSGFADSPQSDGFTAALAATRVQDVPLLYWTAAGWIGAISTDPFDLDLSLAMPHVALLMDRAYELDPDFDDGAIHEFYLVYYAAVPEALGGGRDRARYHFEHAARLAAGTRSSPYVSLATAVSIPEQNLDEFVSLMERALAVDPDLAPQHRLVNTIRRRQAAWYLANLGRFFLTDDGWDDDWEDDDWDDPDWDND